VSSASVRLQKPTSRAQILHGVDQLLHRARQAIKLPNNQRIAGARVTDGGRRFGAIRDGARQLLGEDARAAGLVQRVALKIEALVNR
jgi:hypothetical protein